MINTRGTRVRDRRLPGELPRDITIALTKSIVITAWVYPFPFVRFFFFFIDMRKDAARFDIGEGAFARTVIKRYFQNGVSPLR